MTQTLSRLSSPDPVLLDGALGTELQRRGVPMSDIAWCATALVTHPDLVRAVHADYIRAGAEVITTNSYATARHVLEPAGLGDHVRDLNRCAVELAKEARERTPAARPVLIAGSISTFGAGNDRSALPTPRQERANYREQAEILAEAGVDLLLPENLYSIEQGGYAVEAAVATGLPVWVGFSARRAADGAILMTNRVVAEPLEAGLRAILPLGGQLAAIMHTTIADTGPALAVLRRHWAGPLGAYAHSGSFVMPNWQFVDLAPPDAYARAAAGWIAEGATLVGGCCGIGPDHIAALAALLGRTVTSSTTTGD